MTADTTKTSNPERSSTDVVIFDGQCRFCQAQVDRLKRLDWRGQFTFLSLHDAETAGRYPDLSHEELMRQMVIVDRADRRRRGAGALRYLSRKLPLLWPLVPLLHLPGSLPLWQWLYSQVAKRRYAISGTCENGACRVE